MFKTVSQHNPSTLKLIIFSTKGFSTRRPGVGNITFFFQKYIKFQAVVFDKLAHDVSNDNERVKAL